MGPGEGAFVFLPLLPHHKSPGEKSGAFVLVKIQFCQGPWQNSISQVLKITVRRYGRCRSLM